MNVQFVDTLIDVWPVSCCSSRLSGTLQEPARILFEHVYMLLLYYVSCSEVENTPNDEWSLFHELATNCRFRTSLEGSAGEV